MTTAVVLTTYNRPQALKSALCAYGEQSDSDFELLIADDGSKNETAEIIDTFQRAGNITLRHIWQEDRGFRASAIRNRAIAATNADYIIFSDGDCVPSLRFVEGHRRLAEQGWFVAGNRILLGETITERIAAEGILVHRWTTFDWAIANLSRDANRWFAASPFPLPGILRKIPAKNWEGIMTCNLSCWRKDLLAVNGFDEMFEGWGLEDSDLVIRLLNAGILHKSARFAAPVFHLWHKENDRSSLERNLSLLREIMDSRRIRARKGLEQPL